MAKPITLKTLAGWALAIFLVSVFTGLGIWQVKRLAYKEALIASVQNRAFNLPTQLPEVAQWSQINREQYEYTRVKLRGRFVHTKPKALGFAKTLAVTEQGAGYWVLAPFEVEQGYTVWVNAGFVPQKQEAIALPLHPVEVVGLLRITEPKGGFLRDNQPAAGRWYSRDVSALSTQFGIDNAAPYFVDAFQIRSMVTDSAFQSAHDDALASENASQSPQNNSGGEAPIPGLTVLQFPNNHLSYALTWFAMALGSLGVAVWLGFRPTANEASKVNNPGD